MSTLLIPAVLRSETGGAASIEVEGETVGLEELKTFLLGRDIAKFKLPERLVVVKQFPISAAGKILRRELRQIAASEVAAAPA